ncbi:MAG TPA: 30S ribosome-binding factor RbfA [Chloroflexi bacterium]|nr:30S ribosome-binding factor RbfA [Chloroflexota bacterium]
MVSNTRLQKIEDRIFEELSTILLMEVSDPRLGDVSITKVRVDRELAFANIYVSSLAGSESTDEIIAGLQHASGFLRSELARRMQLRYTPRLRFYWDPSPEHADRIDRLIASLHQEETNLEPEEDEDPLDE